MNCRHKDALRHRHTGTHTYPSRAAAGKVGDKEPQGTRLDIRQLKGLLEAWEPSQRPAWLSHQNFVGNRVGEGTPLPSGQPDGTLGIPQDDMQRVSEDKCLGTYRCVSGARGRRGQIAPKRKLPSGHLLRSSEGKWVTGCQRCLDKEADGRLEKLGAEAGWLETSQEASLRGSVTPDLRQLSISGASHPNLWEDKPLHPHLQQSSVPSLLLGTTQEPSAVGGKVGLGWFWGEASPFPIKFPFLPCLIAGESSSLPPKCPDTTCSFM